MMAYNIKIEHFFLDVCTSKVERNFDGVNEWQYQCICALRHKVGKIDHGEL
jgi:hypothetical protein